MINSGGVGMLTDQIHLLEAVLLIGTHDLSFYNKSLQI